MPERIAIHDHWKAATNGYLINEMIGEPLDDAFRTRCRACNATVWQYPTAKGRPVLLDNAPGGYVIVHGEALHATPDAGYRSHRHDHTLPDQGIRIATDEEAEFLWA